MKLDRHHLTLSRLGGATLTGALVVLSFPRYGFEAGLDGLIWISLVPLFLAAAGVGGRRGFLLGYGAGLVLEAAGFVWILLSLRRFTDLPPAAAATIFLAWLAYAAVPWGILGAALGRAAGPAAILWVLPLWIGVEHCFPRVFPWHLGGALYGREWLVQCADLGGASGLTALVFLSNAVVYLLAGFLRGRNGFPLAPLSCLAVLVAGALIYGRLRIAEVSEAEARAPALRVVLLQGALGPAERNERGLEVYAARTRAILQGGETPDLVVWPEGADNFFFNLTPLGDPWVLHRDGEGSAAPRALLEGLGVPLVAGAGGVVKDRVPAGSNVAVYIEPGKEPLFYEKNRRVPFGENVPGIDLLPSSLRERIAHVGTIARGTENRAFGRKGSTFRCLICYEAVLPDYVREAAEGVDFLVNVTEDVWYGRTAHVPQHVSVLILRGIENRIPIVRATNMGPSGVLDITGRFRHGDKVFEAETVRGEVRARSLPTLYRSGGHLLPSLALCLAVGRWIIRRLWGIARTASQPGRGENGQGGVHASSNAGTSAGAHAGSQGAQGARGARGLDRGTS